MAINPGSLNRRITINAPSTTKDSYGQPLTTFSQLYTCWASVKAISSKELYSIGGFTESATHKIVIRHPSIAITHGMQVVYGQQTLTVQGVLDPDGLKIELDLYCLDVT